MVLRNMTSIYIMHRDRVLLMHREGSRVFSGSLWCGVGGHFEPDELNTPKQCVLRELEEETSIREKDIAGLALRYITMRKKGNEIRQQYIYFATLATEGIALGACDEGTLHWVERSALWKLTMSFTNMQCLRHYFARDAKDGRAYVGAVRANEGVPEIVFTPLEDFDVGY